MKRLIHITILFICSVVIVQLGSAIATAQGSTTYYLSPTGHDSNLGTSEAEAWATFDRAWQDLYPGDTLILMDGIYYQTLRPNKRNGEPGKPITIRAQHDGQAIIDGEGIRDTVYLGDTWPGPIGNWFVIEGIVARNSSGMVYFIKGEHNILRRVSGYNANTDGNYHIFQIWADNNLIEDCVAGGTGRKMVVTYRGDNNIIRRCFTNWHSWDGRNWHDAWPWGDGIQIYFGNYNIIENSISYGPITFQGISIIAPSEGLAAIGNSILGSIAINAGMNPDGTVKYWGCPEKPEPCGPEDRPQPTDYTLVRDFDDTIQRSGYHLFGQGELRDNLFQDIFAWGNAGLGFVYLPDPSGEAHPNTNNNQINRATILNNGLDQPCTGAWPCQGGGLNTDVLNAQLSKPGLNSVTNSYIENIFIDWPSYPGGERNMTSLEGEGARLTHRYVNGVLTDEPLWPWPMADRIQAELGISMSEIENLVSNSGAGFTLSVTPSLQNVGAGDTAEYAIKVNHSGNFTETVTLEIGDSPSSELDIIPPAATTFPEPSGQTSLTLTDMHDPSSTVSEWYTVPITATGGGIIRTRSINLLVNGKQQFLPVIVK